MAADLLKNPQLLKGYKVGGLTLTKWLDANENSVWYEAQEDAGEKRLVYVYKDHSIRDKDRIRVHIFRTTVNESVNINGCNVPLFFIVGDYRIMMESPLRAHLMSKHNLPWEVNGWQAKEVLGHGYKGVTFKARRKGGIKTQYYALKLTVAEEYETVSYLPEVENMAELAGRDRDHFPQIHDCGEWECQIENNTHKLIYFVEDLMLGKTLEKYLESKTSLLSITFLERFVREMLAALVILQDFELMHDDLHAGNIMIQDSLVGIRPSLIDFGSAKKKGSSKKSRDDIRNLAMHIAQVMNLIDMQQNAKTRFEDHILSACRSIHAVMSDDDPMRRVEDASELLDHFDRYFKRGSFKQTLERPFDFGNAEEVMDNELLHKLAAKSFPWRDKIESSSNMLLIGPRGCGKTTIFRSMSFNCLADAGKIEEALRLPYIGLYISCNREFRQRFSAMDRSILKRRNSDIRHYFNLLVLREFIQSLINCFKKGHLSNGDIRKFFDFVLYRTDIGIPVSFIGDAALREMEGDIARAIDSTRMNIWNDNECKNPTKQGFVADLAALANEKLSPFQDKTLYLFIDDYTERKIPREAQRALNHILFVPNAIYKSKISSEVFGVPPDQTFGSFLDLDRDYKELNLGTLYYLKLPSKQQKDFLSEIVDNRLKMCKYQGSVTDIIGKSKYIKGTLARSIKEEADERRAKKRQLNGKGIPNESLEQKIESDLEHEGKKVYYHGWSTICDLCTGDIANILQLLDRMYSECHVTKTSKSEIKASYQHSVIESYARQYIAKIKGIPHYGEKLFEIVDAFGTMSAQLLREHDLVSHGKDRKEPYQLIRIELDEGFVRNSNDRLAQLLDLVHTRTSNISEESAVIWMLLQRYCIFIDAEESRSRRNTLSNKVILRRIFCPAFGMGLANSESFTKSKKEWESFCTDPKGFANRFVREELGDKGPMFPGFEG